MCINFRNTANHPSCKGVYTVTVSSEIEALISKDKDKTEKRGRAVYYLTTYTDPVLFNKENYNIFCRKCSPSFVCAKHAHIQFCSDYIPHKRGDYQFKPNIFSI